MDKQIAGQALKLLTDKDPVQHILLTERLRRGLAEDIAIAGEGVRLLDSGSGNYLFAAERWEDFTALYESARQTPNIFFLSTDTLLARLREHFAPEAFEQWYIGTAYPEDPADPLFDFAPAWEEDLDLIADTYHSVEFDRACLKRMILHRPSVCARCKDGTMAGYMLTHEDGETGPMLVFSDYHGHRLGEQLIRRISNRLLDMGETPIGHITLDNEISKKLHRRMGYEKCPGHVLWVQQK